MPFTPKIHVVLTSIRQNRNGKKVAQWVMDTLANVQEANFELIDLRDYPLPLFDDAIPPSMRKEPHANPAAAAWLSKTAEADAYIFVTAEYNHSITGVFKNAIDFIGSEWHGKAVGFVSYGGLAGGARAVEHMRQIASEMRMHDVRDQVLIPAVWAAFDESGKLEHEEMHIKQLHLVASAVIDLASRLRS